MGAAVELKNSFSATQSGGQGTYHREGCRPRVDCPSHLLLPTPEADLPCCSWPLVVLHSLTASTAAPLLADLQESSQNPTLADRGRQGERTEVDRQREHDEDRGSVEGEGVSLQARQ